MCVCVCVCVCVDFFKFNSINLLIIIGHLGDEDGSSEDECVDEVAAAVTAEFKERNLMVVWLWWCGCGGGDG